MEKLITAPTSEPVSLADAKSHLRVEHTADDTLITRLITAARQHVEDITGLAIGTQQWRAKFDSFDRLTLARYPVQSVDSIGYIDPDGNSQTVASTEYSVLTGLPVEIVEAPGKTWPTPIDGREVVTVDYTCGASPDEPVISAILLILADLYEVREAALIGVSHVQNPAVDALLAPYMQALL